MVSHFWARSLFLLLVDLARIPVSRSFESAARALLQAKAAFSPHQEVVVQFVLKAMLHRASSLLRGQGRQLSRRVTTRLPLAQTPASSSSSSSSSSLAPQSLAPLSSLSSLRCFSTQTATAPATSYDDDHHHGHDDGEARLEPSQAGSMLDIGTRRIFNEEHDAFRETLRQFFAEEVVPHHASWEADGTCRPWAPQLHVPGLGI